MLKKLERMLPHAVILICNMYIVFFLIDRVNQAMNFIDNGLTKGLLAIMCAIALYDAWRLLKPAPAPMPRRRPAPRDSYDTVAAPREREGRYASRSRLYEDGYRGSGNYGAGGTPRNDHRTDRYGGSRHEVHYRSTDVRSGDYRRPPPCCIGNLLLRFGGSSQSKWNRSGTPVDHIGMPGEPV